MSSPAPSDDEPRPAFLALVHHHPGRLRVRAERLRSDPDLAAHVLGALEGVAGVVRASHNAQTGSILVEYEPGFAEPQDLIEEIACRAGLLSPFDPRAEKPVVRPAAVVIDAARDLDAACEQLTGARAGLRVLVPAALAGVAAYSFVRGAGSRLPRWDNLVWWAYSIFASLHAAEIQRR